MAQFLTWRGMQSARDSGYKNTTYALAGLIDNAFDWGSTDCRILFIEQEYSRGSQRVTEIIIVDNGLGMSRDVQSICLAMGGGENHNESTRLANKRIGKFGMGLPQASISQCRKTDVFTWQDSSRVRSVSLDFDDIEKSESIDIPEVVDCDLPSYFADAPLKIHSENSSGTIVRWRECDRLSNVLASTLIRKSEHLLGKIYRYPLSDGKRRICLEHYSRSVNNVITKCSEKRYVRPNDPLFLMDDTSIGAPLHEVCSGTDTKLIEAYEPFLKANGGCSSTSERLEDHCFTDTFEWAAEGALKSFRYEITTSVAHEKIQKPNIRNGGTTKVGQWYQNLGCEIRNYHNISFVRSGREIHSGRFQFPIKSGDIPEHRWWHVEVKFNSDLDDLLGVAWNKQAVGFLYSDEKPLYFDEHLSDLGTAKEEFQFILSNQIQKAYEEAFKKVKERGKVNPGGKDEPTIPVEDPDTTSTTVDVDGVTDEWTIQKIESVVERLKKKFPDVAESEIVSSVNEISLRKLPSILIYTLVEGPQFWDVEMIQSFPVITVNMNHPFYENHIHPLRGDEKSSQQISSIELLIKALAFEETRMGPQEQETIRDFRDGVSLKLRSYLNSRSASDQK